jgi:glycosyltransferase involved in cell wall biosynthesis
MQAEYEALAQSLDLQDCVTFTGGLEDPRSYMAAADIFVLASIADPAPLVLSEARQFGCAIIATDVDGIPEMLDHGAAGVLVPPASPEMLARAILDLLQDANLRAQYGRRARTGIARFSVERVAREALAVYQEAMRSHSPVRIPLSFEHPGKAPAEDKANVEI